MPRYSCDKNDPGYAAFDSALRDDLQIQITLNGERLYGVVTADEELELVIMDLKDKNGDYLIEGDEFVRVERHGRVEVFCERIEKE